MILVGYDGSEHAAAAIRWATPIAMRRQELLRVLAAVPTPIVPGNEFLPPATTEEFVAAAGKVAADGVGLARAAGATDVEGRGVTANPAHALVEASAGASLVVVGNRGHHELVETMLGSVSWADDRLKERKSSFGQESAVSAALRSSASESRSMKPRSSASGTNTAGET